MHPYLGDDAHRAEAVAVLKRIILDRHTVDQRAAALASMIRTVAADQLRFSINIEAHRGAIRRESFESLRTAYGLAASLFRLGQAVRTNFADQWHAFDAIDDDVVITVRGIVPFYPRAHQINVLLVPEVNTLISSGELTLYDAVYGSPEAVRQIAAVGGARELGIALPGIDPVLLEPGESALIGEIDILVVGFGGDHPEAPSAVEYLARHGHRVVHLPEFEADEREVNPFTRIGLIDRRRAEFIRASKVVVANLSALAGAGVEILRNLADCQACGCIVAVPQDHAVQSDSWGMLRTFDDAASLAAILTEARHREEAGLRTEAGRGFGLEHSFDRIAGTILEATRRHDTQRRSR
jgi:hypothetical protein